MLHEFALVCGLPLDLHAFIKTGAGGQRTVNTASLIPYVRSVAINLLIKHEVPLDLKFGDWVYTKTPRDFDITRSNDAPSLETMSPTELVISRALLAETEAQDASSETRSTRRTFSPPSGSHDELSSPRQILKCWGNLRCGFDPDEEEEYAWSPTKLSRADSNSGLADRSDVLNRCEDFSMKRLISLWRETRGPPTPESDDRFSRFGDCIREVRRMMWLALSNYDPILRLEIAYSIDALCSNLVSAVARMFKVKIDNGAAKLHYYNTQFVNGMKAGNWCLARTDLVLPSNVNAIYFKSMLLSYESRSHIECTPTACSRQPQDVSSLDAQRDLDTCGENCQVFSFDEQKLIGVLEADGILGIFRAVREGGKVDFEVVDVTGKDYIGISHVWSHGLGNPTQNALPLCQIERLFRYIQAIGPPNAILWIDTL
ncbi:hypothetical protein IFR05_012491 [Cadophora sp. M221]|nr:hypothetical protein IFR05_012491 [Cadophora sp. M221]